MKEETRKESNTSQSGRKAEAVEHLFFGQGAEALRRHPRQFRLAGRRMLGRQRRLVLLEPQHEARLGLTLRSEKAMTSWAVGHYIHQVLNLHLAQLSIHNNELEDTSFIKY